MYFNRSLATTEEQMQYFLEHIEGCLVYDVLDDEDIKTIVKICDMSLEKITNNDFLS